MNNNNSKMIAASKVVGKTKRTYGGGGKGFGLMKLPNRDRNFGRGGKHKLAGKLRPRSPRGGPMRLSYRLSRKIRNGSPLKSPITAFTIDWTPRTKRNGDVEREHAMEEEVETPVAKQNEEED